MNITIPLRELINILLLEGLFGEQSLIRYPSLSEKLCYFPNATLARELQIIHLVDEFGHGNIYTLPCARMKIEQILGYTSEEILAWDDETLIRNCHEHFVYTRPQTPLPKEEKKKKAKEVNGGDGIVDLTESKPRQRKLSPQEEAAQALSKLLSPESLEKFKQLQQ